MGSNIRFLSTSALWAMALSVMVAGTALAQDDMAAAAPEDRVSGEITLDWNTHFILYGVDVWGGGNDFGKNSTFNPAASVNIALCDSFNLFAGTWWDVNDNAPATLGGSMQEVDVWVGADVTIQKFTLSVTGQQWMFGGTVDTIIDLGLSYDDSELWGDSGFALNPSFLAHYDNDVDGWVYVFGIEPGTTLNADGSWPVDLSIPVSIGFGDDNYYADSGFAYASIGAQFSVPLTTLIDESYGAWSLNFGVTYYHTDDDAIGNPDDDFVTGNVGLALAF